MKHLEPNLPAVPEPFRVANQPLIVDAEYESGPAHVPLSHYLWILRRHGWKMLGFVTLVVLCTVVVSLRLTPIYESTATIDIDRRMPTGVLGEDSTQAVNNDADQFLATQVKLIQSDSVLRPVVDKFKLREVEPDALEEAVDNSGTSREAPVELKPLRVTRPPNTYILQISYRSQHRQLAADVANAIAQSYLAHSYAIRYKATASLSEFMERQLEELKAKMEKSSAALVQFERELNLINPEEKTSILTARLLELNSEYTKAQADRVRKEAAYNSVDSGSLAAAQASNQGEGLKKLAEDLGEAQQRFAEGRMTYGANHPEYKKLQSRVTELEAQLDAGRKNVARRAQVEYYEAADRESQLENAVKGTKAEYDRLNSRSFEYQTLKREAEGDKKLYEELVRRIKEAGINASFQNSSIRVADLARPGLRPVFPRFGLNLVLALLLSTLIAIGLAVVADLMDNTVRDPEQVARTLNTHVIGSLPAVKDWKHRLAALPSPESTATLANGNGRVLHDGTVSYEEAIRTLRNSILLTDFDHRLRSVLLTSASPSEGKSTVAAHLAATHAEQLHRTLLIDADLRRPSAHKLFRLPNRVGLSSALLGEIPWRDALVRPTDALDLYVLPAGPSTRRASDLVGRGLVQLLDEAVLEFDFVILDAPPLLGFAEPLQMATAVDGVIIVTRAGQTTKKGVANVLRTLARLRANVVGVVLNEVHRHTSDSSYYYGYYGRYYNHYHGRNGQAAAGD
jgi:capsular exopolysaccharide synthesis family protein